MSACEDCPAGTTATTGQASCVECAAGRYNNVTRSTSCEACPLGHYASDPGATQCEPCDRGYYADYTGKVAPQTPPAPS
eukprot:5859522-Amphidinium_carterae.1